MNIPTLNNMSFGERTGFVTVNNQHGIHLRPAGEIVKITKVVGKPIYFATDAKASRNINSSVIGIVTLEPVRGTRIKVTSADDYPRDAFEAILNCISANDDNETTEIAKNFVAKKLNTTA